MHWTKTAQLLTFSLSLSLALSLSRYLAISLSLFLSLSLSLSLHNIYKYTHMYTQESLHSAAATSTRDSSHRDDVLLNGFGRPDTLGAHKLGIFYC